MLKENVKNNIIAGAIIVVIVVIFMLIYFAIDNYNDQRQADEVRAQWQAAMKAQPIDIGQILLLDYRKLDVNEVEKMKNEFLSVPYVKQMMNDYEALLKQQDEFEDKYNINEDIVTMGLIMIDEYINQNQPPLSDAEKEEMKEKIEEMLK